MHFNITKQNGYVRAECESELTIISFAKPAPVLETNLIVSAEPLFKY